MESCDVTPTALTTQTETHSSIETHLIFRAVERIRYSEMMTLRNHRC